VTLAVNLAIVAVAFVIGTLSGLQIQHAIVFVLLISVIVTGYDRYRPLYKARFSNGPLRAPG
jgi:cytochrome b subunit of formate dehydrogenase